jgi:UDP-2,3-diacylglucosamine hydrolase
MAGAYAWADRFGVTRLVHEWEFPRHPTVQRLLRFFDFECPGWRRDTRDCYFGHTHLPFADYEAEGIRFHNTGSAIRGAPFNPRRFTANPAAA